MCVYVSKNMIWGSHVVHSRCNRYSNVVSLQSKWVTDYICGSICQVEGGSVHDKDKY